MSTTTALLVIDVQVGLIAGENPVYQADTILERIAGLIAAARAAGTPVIYVQDKDVGGVGTPEWQITRLSRRALPSWLFAKPGAICFTRRRWA